VAILNDGVNDPDKSFQVQLSNATERRFGHSFPGHRDHPGSHSGDFHATDAGSQSVSLGAVVKIQASAKGARMQWQRRVGRR
jgi:hypothetical protein